MHGGKQPRGPDSPNFKHGLYSHAFKGDLLKEFQHAQQVDDPLNLAHELAAQRAIFTEFIGRFVEGYKLSANEIDALYRWIDGIGRTVDRIVRARNEATLTAAQVLFLKAGIVALLADFVPEPDRRRAFMARLDALIPERSGSGVGSASADGNTSADAADQD